ncbi:MAG: UDP-N-acetylmuramoylalanyl-D-glutamyl-2,6-diaminopimelate-D-alanyl-alanyl ligase, partial [Frankiales bacterium]|nr:UDP-N-acetylmuramoylalanyl-D-glutamyl-2,6-diaminopimelate-D-alanyl-alanyl ligase [Frankiales bacterium]
MTIGAIAAVVSGEVVGLAETVVVTGKVEFDSRRVQPGDLFLAFVGDRVDGHDFARQALDAGAVAMISTRPLPMGSVVVTDPIEAITALADHVGHQLSA